MNKWMAMCFLLLPAMSFADERILSFHSNIVVQQDGWIEVTETISVRVEGQRIRRGIYRDFPTRYRDVYGNNREVDYRPLSVLRNDEAEDFHSERLGNGMRIYFGSADRLLSHGVHTYTFRYTASRMLGFFENHDELYWNVTGLEWPFPIDQAGATVTLDFDGEPQILQADGFTGVMGAQGREFSKQISGGSAIFKTTDVLLPHEGLTIVISWDKGFVTPPGQIRKLNWLLSDNLSLLIVLCGLAAMLSYLLPVWRTFGRDPEEGRHWASRGLSFWRIPRRPTRGAVSSW